LVSEPIFITTQDFGPYLYGKNTDYGGQYFTFCYVGQIPADAVRLAPSFLTLSFLKNYSFGCWSATSNFMRFSTRW
jgi:hypothetical protein